MSPQDFTLRIFIALVPGAANALASYSRLDNDCRFLPFFSPFKVPGFWVWLVLQIAIPAFAFWVFFQMASSSTQITLQLFFVAISFGIGFSLLLNLSTAVGPYTITIKPLYDLLIQLAYDMIAHQERARSAAFWHSLEIELCERTTQEIDLGVKYLKRYYETDIKSSSSNVDNQKIISSILKKSEPLEKVKDVIPLIMNGVKRKDLPLVLKTFNCDSSISGYTQALASPKQSASVGKVPIPPGSIPPSSGTP